MGTEAQSVDLDSGQVQALKERLKARSLKEEDYGLILGLIETLLLIKASFENKRDSVRRLLRMLFGAPTETARNVLSRKKKDRQEHETDPGTTSSEPEAAPKGKPKGHGRNGADCFPGAKRVPVPHRDERLKPGALCPLCKRAKLYLLAPARFVRIIGRPPLDAELLECERTRCALCGQVFTAPLPEQVGGQKYDASAGAILANLKYGSGVPFYRLERLQESLGIPMPDSTQWDLVEQVADRIQRVFPELIRVGAQARIIHNDDTTMTVLSLLKEIAREESATRTGIFTTALLCITDEGQRIALFFTGRCHAGENLEKVLKERSPEREPAIQMCDAASRNKPKGSSTIECNCLTHGRRNYVDVAESFPDECAYVIEALGKVYHNESIIKGKGLNDDQRLEYHKMHSAPVMEELHQWGSEQLAQRNVEPNSGLGKAIKYMLKHWKELTVFLRVPGAPIDNNLCEQILKFAILNRKNSLFYRTEHGAYVGDMFMSLIHTCTLNGVSPFEYITILQIHSSEVFKNPDQWLPWNYTQNLDQKTC